MSPETGVAVMVLDLVTTALRDHDEGRSAPETICAGVAAMVGASMAAYVHVDLVRAECHMVCRPFSLESGPEVPDFDLAPETWPGWSAPTLSRFESPRGSALLSQPVRTGETAEISLSAAAGVLRLLAVSRDAAFTAREREVLRFAQPTLAVLDLHLQSLERLCGAAHDSALADRADGDASSRRGITNREYEVLALLSECLLARGIAARMGISPRTVQKHLGSLYRKLDTHDRLTAVTRARALGLLPPV